VHYHPKFSAVSALSSSIFARSANLGTPRTILYSREHFLHDSTPSIISLPSYLLAYGSNISPPQIGHANRSKSLSFIQISNADWADEADLRGSIFFLIRSYP